MKRTKSTIILLLLIPFFAFSQKKPEEDKKINFAFIPIISYNRSFGGQFGIMTNAYFDVNKKDTISPASSIGFYGHIFTNKTFFTGIFNRLYFKEDRWRTKFGIGYGNINFQSYFDIPEDVPAVWAQDDNGEFIDYNTQMTFIYAEGMRLLFDHLYLGMRIVFSGVNTEFDDENIPDENLSLFGFGLMTEYDKRDNVFNPHTGFNARFKHFSFLESLGSSQTYHQINIDYNQYFPLGENSLIMGRIYAMISVGDSVPFNGKNVVGRDDLRGYTDGKYRANHVYDLQTEYRWNFYKKWGMVAFGGIAIATDDWHGNNYSGILPAIGAGLRFKAIPKRNINVGIDAAIGKEDWGLYFRIGETFTR